MHTSPAPRVPAKLLASFVARKRETRQSCTVRGGSNRSLDLELTLDGARITR